jgi:hypothetical protein
MFSIQNDGHDKSKKKKKKKEKKREMVAIRNILKFVSPNYIELV